MSSLTLCSAVAATTATKSVASSRWWARLTIVSADNPVTARGTRTHDERGTDSVFGRSTRWRVSRSRPRADESDDTMSESDAEGSTSDNWSTRLRSSRNWRRAAESDSIPDINAMTSSGWTSTVATSATMRPCRRIVMRSARSNTSSMRCDTSRIATPRARSLRSKVCNARDSFTPSAAVGSSRISTSGRPSSALAIATDCR